MSDDLDFGATIKGMVPGQSVFGRYTLQKILGRGGMGVVWLAHDEDLERDVALKFLPEVVAGDKQAVKSLKRETRRSLDLTHPNIVRIYDFVQDDASAAISMEFVAGDTLASLKVDQPNERFEVAQLEKWVEQLCDALSYAHNKARVVHRDLKPANLMVDAEGDLKIADFGIAASVSESVSRVSVQAGTSGTPVYMSPQQMMGEIPSITDDIYAAGSTLYELLTSRPPFYSGRVDLQVMNKVPDSMTQRRSDLEIAGENIPGHWEKVIAAMLSKQPEDRPATIAAVKGALLKSGSLKSREEPVVVTSPPLPPEPRTAPAAKVDVPPLPGGSEDTPPPELPLQDRRSATKAAKPPSLPEPVKPNVFVVGPAITLAVSPFLLYLGVLVRHDFGIFETIINAQQLSWFSDDFGRGVCLLGGLGCFVGLLFVRSNLLLRGALSLGALLLYYAHGSWFMFTDLGLDNTIVIPMAISVGLIGGVMLWLALTQPKDRKPGPSYLRSWQAGFAVGIMPVIYVILCVVMEFPLFDFSAGILRGMIEIYLNLSVPWVAVAAPLLAWGKIEGWIAWFAVAFIEPLLAFTMEWDEIDPDTILWSQGLFMLVAIVGVIAWHRGARSDANNLTPN